MAHWDRTVNIKEHITDGDTLYDTIKAMTGILSVIKTDKELREEFETEFDQFLENAPLMDADEAQSEANWILSDLYDYADNRRIWLGI